MGMIEQRLVAVVASYKIQLGIPFSPIVALVAPAVVAMHGQRFDLPTVEDAEGDGTDADGDASNPGRPLSIAEIRTQATRGGDRGKWGVQSMQERGTAKGTAAPPPSTGGKFNGAASARLPPPT